MNRIRILLAAVALAGAQAWAQRPHSPFVERVVTNDRSRQLKVALNSSLWIMYDLPQCQLYQAWSGGANGGSLIEPTVGPDGLFFDQKAHVSFWFITSGTNYFREPVGEYFADWAPAKDIDLYYTKWKKQPRNYQAWTVSNGGQAVATRTRYGGYSVNASVFKLYFSLVTADGEIAVTEIPEYQAGGRAGMTRKFTFAGIPAGHSVSLQLCGSGWSGTGVSGKTFTVSNDGTITITGSW